MKLIIGLTGKARSGKDFLADHLVDALGLERHAFADDLKDIYCAGHMLSREALEDDKETHRQGLIDLSEIHLKKYDRAFFGKRFMDKVTMPEYTDTKSWVITDFRYREEYEHLIDLVYSGDIALLMIEVSDEEKSIENCGYQLQNIDINFKFNNTYNVKSYRAKVLRIVDYIKGFIAGHNVNANFDSDTLGL